MKIVWCEKKIFIFYFWFWNTPIKYEGIRPDDLCPKLKSEWNIWSWMVAWSRGFNFEWTMYLLHNHIYFSNDLRCKMRWKYEICMSPHNAFGIYESNNLTLKWLLNNSIQQKKIPLWKVKWQLHSSVYNTNEKT